jgi:Tfp pilus assembly protein PilZ
MIHRDFSIRGLAMPKMTVLISSRTEQENYILQRKLEFLEPEFTGLGFAGVHPMGLPAAIDHHTGLIVLNFNEWTRRESIHLDEIADVGYTGRILVIAKADVTAAISEMQAQPNVVFLEKPFEVKDLQGMARKMLLDRVVQQRIHRRFNTDQDAEVEISGHADRFFSRVCNLSKGGAYLEFMTLAAVKVGEMVRLKMELKDLNRTYTMPAKIIWTNRTTMSGGTGIGVEFVGPGDVQKLILGY